jgi:hypothetical protein
MTLKEEIANSFAIFQEDWQKELAGRISDLPNHSECLGESYRRLTTLQAWRANIIATTLSEGSFAFFAEAQNDALISHVQASLGSWRVALKSLRSCIENMLMCLYYKDHSVELRRWEKGEFRLGVAAAISYFESHPTLKGVPCGLTGLEMLGKEYSDLSLAVHGSSKSFRMTDEGKAVALWKMDEKFLSIWSSHEKKTISAINLLLLAMFHEQLEGAKASALREALAFAISSKKDAEIKSILKVSIKRR